ncbi:hypothetical protein AAE02nite_02560 [Adhaeribacter aerolatus]|uniref:Uncharacterized protein n=2 Tax=Adhaeribacter aerolatus TaxID=670289 RepID=A0A512ASB4_9BACT|nr:hypothetical protein AAE02nite_02560 [Adhaeribacter aerolatus]
MDTGQHIIELKFEGNGIKPSKVKASEVAELIASFEGAILAVVKQQNPEVNEADVLISFEEIRDQSLSIKCLSHISKYVLPAYAVIATSFTSDQYSNLPSSSVDNLKKIAKFSKRHECEGVFIQDGERIATFNKDTEIVVKEAGTLRGDTTIYGTVLKAGGDTPRVTLKIDDDYTVSFEVKKDIVIKLAENLYKEVGVKGNAKWDKRTYQVLEFRAESVIYIEQVTIQDTFKQLGDLLSKTLHKVDDINSLKSNQGHE